MGPGPILKMLSPNKGKNYFPYKEMLEIEQEKGQANFSVKSGRAVFLRKKCRKYFL